MLKLKTVSLLKHRSDLSILPEGKLLINTINAHSYNTALKDAGFAEALLKGGALIPDGASMVLAFRWLRKESIERTAGWDLFEYEMERLNRKGGICYFLGSSKNTLKLIKEKAKTVYPNIRIETYSPPYKPEFTEEENQMMIDAINAVKPDLLWIGMTAPKQEKWGVYASGCTGGERTYRNYRSGIRLLCGYGGTCSGPVARARTGMAVSLDQRA